jgi:hypothetical protein
VIEPYPCNHINSKVVCNIRARVFSPRVTTTSLVDDIVKSTSPQKSSEDQNDELIAA